MKDRNIRGSGSRGAGGHTTLKLYRRIGGGKRVYRKQRREEFPTKGEIHGRTGLRRGVRSWGGNYYQWKFGRIRL